MSDGFEHPRAKARDLGERVTELVARASAVLHRRAVAAVLEVLAKFCNGEGRCFCSQETIAAKARFSVRHVIRALEQAEASGLLLRAVPRYAARLAGTSSEYSLPWLALTVERGLAGAREVLGLRRRGPLASITRGTAARLVEALELVHPAELVRRVASAVGGVLGAEVVRAYASGLVPREGSGAGAAAVASVASSLVTPRPDKTSQRATLGSDRASSGGEMPSDRGAVRPAGGDASFAARLRAASERALGALAARDASCRSLPPPEIS